MFVMIMVDSYRLTTNCSDFSVPESVSMRTIRTRVRTICQGGFGHTVNDQIIRTWDIYIQHKDLGAVDPVD